MANAEPAALNEALNWMRKIYGYASFRGLQSEVLTSVLAGKDTLALLPTGSGKSLCYLLPSRIFFQADDPGLTLVISPLIALMQDQVQAAAAKGFRVGCINSSLSSEQKAQQLNKLKNREFEIFYMTPERFRNDEFLAALATNRIALLAVDEAHCISQWGQDFRPDYSRLGEIRKNLGSPPTLALTATASPRVEMDILMQLRLAADSTNIYRESVVRPNLALRVLAVHGEDEKIRSIVMAWHLARAEVGEGACIVYFSLVRTLERFSEQLERLNLSHLIYHGQLNASARRRAQNEFLQAPAPLVLATPAFGLGIDKENVRLVLHAEMPGSVESYVQEFGRAGRDGLPSQCVLLHDDDDLATQTEFIKWSNPDPGFIQALYNLIERNPLRLQSEGLSFLRSQLNYFNRRDFRVETAIGLLERWGSLSETDPKKLKVVHPPEGDWMSEDLWQKRFKSLQQKLLQMQEFASGFDECRMLALQKYFGEVLGHACGICDWCLSQIGDSKT